MSGRLRFACGVGCWLDHETLLVVTADVAFEDGNYRQDHHGLDEDQDRACEVDLIEEGGAQTGAEGRQIERQNRLRVG